MGCDIEHGTASDRVTVVFDGYLSAEEGATSAAAFREALESDQLDVVWDLSRMTGFDGGARNAWAEALWPVRGKIKSLRIIGAKGIVRVGATFLAVLLGKPYEFVDSARAGPRE